MQISISRPEIVIDQRDNVYINTRSDQARDRMTATLLLVPDYHYQLNNIKVLDEQNQVFSEPVIDRERWQHETILSMQFQYNDQPDHDTGPRLVQSPISLVDLRLRRGDEHKG